MSKATLNPSSLLYKLTVTPCSHIAPGGYIEQSEPIPELQTDDSSIASGDVMFRCSDIAREASLKFGKNMTVAPLMKKMIEEAGFVDVIEKRYKWPVGEWPADHRLKEIGRWNVRHWVEGLEAWTLRLLTQYCGVSQPSSVPVLIRGSREGSTCGGLMAN